MKNVFFVLFLVLGAFLSFNLQAGFFDFLTGNQQQKTISAPTKVDAPKPAPPQTLNSNPASPVILNTMDGTHILERSQYCAFPPALANELHMTTSDFLCEGIDSSNPENLDLYNCHIHNTDMAFNNIYQYISVRNECRDRNRLTGYTDYALRCGNPRETYDHGTPFEDVVRIWRDMGCDCIEDLKKFYREMQSACNAPHPADKTFPSSSPPPK